MKISYDWLRQYLSVTLPPARIAEMLTGCGLEVESMEPWHNAADGNEDMIFQIGLTPNRTDAMSHLGVARDIVAVFNNQGRETVLDEKERASLIIPGVDEFKPDHSRRRTEVFVEDPLDCPRYSGLTMTGIRVSESPVWLQHRLLSVGLRPVNNIVDITNFVLMELGQPLHAFDADKIDRDKVVVKKFPEETPFVTLDEVLRMLTPQDLMICDANSPMCIAGVFGGIESGVTVSTRNIFLESACFNPVSVRRTARYHGLQTDASFRFERGTDIEMTLFALKRAALLIREIAGGEISSVPVDIFPDPLKGAQVRLTYRNLDRLTGQEIPRDTVRNILTDLGIQIVKEESGALDLLIPLFKVDVNREADVIEEILRIYGYNNIRIPHEVKSSFTPLTGNDPDRIRNLVCDLLSANGFYEIINNSLTDSAYYMQDPVFLKEKCVRILNPSSRDLDVMRQTLLFGGLESLGYNLNRKSSDLLFFELGKVYSVASSGSSDPLPGYHEEQRLALFLTGRKHKESWDTDNAAVDLFQIKGILEGILRRVSIDTTALRIVPSRITYFSNGIDYQTEMGETLIAAGTLSRSVVDRFEIKQPVLWADLNWDLLLRLIPLLPSRYVELPKFPVVRRDLALLLDNTVQFSQIRSIAFETEKRLLIRVDLFDVYEGEKIGSGKKSYAVSFLLGDESKTLMDAEIDSVMERMVKAFTTKLEAVIR